MSGNYKNSKIYIIRSNKTDSVYVGSTYNTLECRFSGHKSTHNCSKKKVSSSIIFNYGINDAYIELLEEYPCNSRDELLKREGELMRTIKNCVNKENPHDEYLDKRIELKNSEEYKKTIKMKEDKHKNKVELSLKKRKDKLEKEKIKMEIEREIERKIEIEKQIEIEKNRPKNLDIELEKENITNGILPFNTSKDGNPMFVRENREAYYKYRNKISNTVACLLYKEHKINEAEKEAKKKAEAEAEAEKDVEIIKRKKTKKQREREKEKQIEKEKIIFKEFCNRKEFKYHMLYVNWLENIKMSNGREWLEKIYKDRYDLDMYRVEYEKKNAVQYNNFVLDEDILSHECKENIYIYLEKKYNIECDTIIFE